jgi:hypothetical protein
VAGDAGEISGSVNVVRTAGVTALDQGDQVRSGAQEGARTGVTGRGRDDVRPVLARY